MALAVVLATEVQETNGGRTFVLDKVEAIDPSQSENAIQSFKKLRRFCQGLSPQQAAKKQRNMCLGDSPGDAKRCRTLGRAPADVDFPHM